MAIKDAYNQSGSATIDPLCPVGDYPDFVVYCDDTGDYDPVNCPVLVPPTLSSN